MDKKTSTDDLDDWVVTSSTLAEALGGVSKRTIERYASDNLVVRVGHGRYLLLQSVWKVVRHFRKQAAERVGRDEQVDAVRANVELRDAQRRLMLLKLKQLEEQQITLPEVQAAWEEIGRILKEKCLSFPARIRSLLPHLDDKDQEVLGQLAHEMLNELPFCSEPPRLPEGCRGSF